MPKKNRPSMSVSEFAALKGVSRQAVAKAIESGAIPPESTAWRKAGKRRVLTIVDVPLASRSWVPTGPASLADEVPGELTDASSAREAKRHLLVFRAKAAKLDFEAASGKLVDLEEVRLHLATAFIRTRNAVMQIGWKAMSELSLSRDQACTINDLARDILTELAESTKRTLAKAAKPRKGAPS